MRIYRTGWVIGCVALVLIGVGPAGSMGTSMSVLVVVVLLSSPPVIGGLWRVLSSVPTLSPDQLTAIGCALGSTSVGYVGPPQTCDAPGLSDEQLCRQWRTSCRRLRDESGPVPDLTTVEQRQWYLDEFEHRNARGFVAWLASGAPENVLDYLNDGRHGLAIDWDELTRG